jgi:Fic family protein
MLGVIDESLSSMLDFKGKTMSSQERLNYFIELSSNAFSRKDYMAVFKEISTATASRDLKLGVELGFFEKQGVKTNTIYKML